MERPYKFIDCRMAVRNEFDVTVGRQPTWALFFLLGGSFRLDIDGTEEIITTGDCVIFPDDLDFSRNVITPIVFVYIKFQVNPKCKFTLRIPSGRINFIDNERFMSSIHTYEELIDSTTPTAIYYKEHLLEDILFQLCRENSGSDRFDSDTALNECHDTVVLRAVEYICGHLSAKLTVDEICREACTNTSTLNFKFRRELSSSVGGFVTCERMKLARRLLAGTTYTVTHIAERCGYENLYYFSTIFKKQVGITPSAYRKQFRY